jgi:hypothetical protein
MKTSKWVTGVGSVVTFVVGILHGLKLADVMKMVPAGGLPGPLEGILKGCWLAFSGKMVATGVIAVVASQMQNGARIVLLCAAATAVDCLLLLKFLGLFAGVYISAFVAAMLFIGGLLQSKEAKG